MLAVGGVKTGDWVVTCSLENVIWLGRVAKVNNKTNECTITYYEKRGGASYIRSNWPEPWVEHIDSVSVIEDQWMEYDRKTKQYKCKCNLRDYVILPIVANARSKKRHRNCGENCASRKKKKCKSLSGIAKEERSPEETTVSINQEGMILLSFCKLLMAKCDPFFRGV
jgi:hypothetical protein